MDLARDKAFNQNIELNKKLNTLKDKYNDLTEKYNNEKRNYTRQCAANKKLKDEYESKMAEKDKIIDALKREVERLTLLANTDGTNAGIPTSQTPINKKKIIPNSRVKTGAPRGGVLGHKKSSLEQFPSEETTDTIKHEIEDGTCPKCGGHDLICTDKTITKQEIDVEVKVKKINHEYVVYLCADCGEEVHVPIENRLKEKVQYGPNLQSFILSLANSCNVTMNKIASLIAGLTDDEITPSEGYIAKLQKRAFDTLNVFRTDLKCALINLPLIYWDDTVIFINKARGIIRFYGNEKLAYYVAHQHKDMDSLDEDHILNLLNEEQATMHDHFTGNYNERYVFMNLECNQHLLRDLQKTTDNTQHKWSGKLKQLISSYIHKRKEVMKDGRTCFTEEELNEFYRGYTECILEGRAENQTDVKQLYNSDEKALLNRLDKYNQNYFMWITDFSLPTTNNISESALRSIKSKLHACGQFYSETTADYYACIKSYIETCKRCGKNEMIALQKLLEGNPYTVAELLEASNLIDCQA